MNKKIIKKYKEAFNYWLDGGKVWLKWNNIHGSKWELESHYDWKEADSCMGGEIVSVVQNDEYAEFSKAQVDGKTIQWKNTTMSYPIYEDIKDNIDCYTLCSLRIKPDEPAFKVGDWVVEKSNGDIKQTTCMPQENWTTRSAMYERLCEPWKPQPGEWCWFYGIQKHPILDQFHSYGNSGRYKTKRHSSYTHCEPFIGTLPTNLKDN